MILVVGPTGSGKTTTLCSALMSMQSERTNVITIEDPIEYQLPGINQTQVNEKIKLTFSSALRSILRQDPDVILVGEIRDQETARIAMQAAQTGHLVLSTLHTDDAPSVVTRLIDIGVEPYVIASATVGVVAQRLVRRLCAQCRRQYTPGSEVLRALNINEADAANIPFYRPVGLRRVPPDRLSRPHRHLRSDEDHRSRAPHDLRSASRGRDSRGRAGHRHADARRRRAGQSEGRRDDRRRAAARGHRSARDAHRCVRAAAARWRSTTSRARPAAGGWAARARAAAAACRPAGRSVPTAPVAPSRAASGGCASGRRRELPAANITNVTNVTEFKKGMP